MVSESSCLVVGYMGHDLNRGCTRSRGRAKARKAASGWYCISFVGADGKRRQRRVPSQLEFTVAGLLNALGGVL